MTAISFQPRIYRFPAGLVLPCLIVVTWEAATRGGLLNPILMPAPSLVFHRLVTMLMAGELWGDIGASLGRLTLGAVAGGLLAIPFGLLIGSNRLARSLLGPTFNVLKQIALFAWIPLLSVWFGTGEAAKVVFVTMAVFTPVAINTWEGAAEVPDQLREVALTCGLGLFDRLGRLILPAALPQIVTGVRLGLIYGWLATVGAEYFLAVAPGIGSQMTAGRELLEMDLVMVGVLLLGAIGLAINFAADAAERRLVYWKVRR